MSVTIAQATIRELDDAAVLFDEYRVFYAQESDVEGAKTFLFDRLEHRESVIFLSRDEADGTAVGFMQLYPLFSSVSMKRIWLLNDLYVCESHRSKQVGKGLLEAAREFAVLTKSKGLEIATQVTNVRAQKVYVEHGYVLDDEFFHYYMLV
jgi:GNAT superfamily N-acetyltransferase